MLLHQIKMPVQKRSIERLEKVIATTIHLLETQPLEQCSIQEISTVSGVPRNHIYQYFPTIDHLYSLIVSRYFSELRPYLVADNSRYKGWKALDILEDVLAKACDFYNKNRVASVLILGGPVNIDGFSLQETVIEQISADMVEMFKQLYNNVALKNPNDMTFMLELVFALMKHSFYRHGSITLAIQQEILLVCDMYSEKKGMFDN